jgi:hypothetical protein
VLSAVFLSSRQSLFSGAGGIAAAIAIGAFIGQAIGSFFPSSEIKRRRYTAVGGLIGLVLIIGLILYSEK